MWTSDYLYIPGILAVVLFFVGLGGPWRRTIGYVVCTYAAIVIASQHYSALTGFASRQFGLAESSLSWRQQGSLVFSATLGVLYVGLLALYGAVWRPRGSDSGKSDSGGSWSQFARGLICLAMGWVIGSIILVAVVVTTSGVSVQALQAELRRTNAAVESGIVFGVNEITGHLIQPWLPGELPPVF